MTVSMLKRHEIGALYGLTRLLPYSVDLDRDPAGQLLVAEPLSGRRWVIDADGTVHRHLEAA